MGKQVGVSNSEAQNAYSCEGAWGFAFHPDMNYQLRRMTVARERGILMHSTLETYYRELMHGEKIDEAAQKALDFVQKERVGEVLAGDFCNVERLEALNWIYEVFTRYVEFYEVDVKNWRILEVESFHELEQEGESDFYLPMRLDLVVYQLGGKFKGEISPVDHKTTYDFWTKAKLNLNSQFPLYIKALRKARFEGIRDTVVKRVILNQIRTRELKDPTDWQLFKREFKDYDTDRIQRVFDNHMKTAVHLAYLKRLSWNEAVSEIRFALGSNNCQYCDFKDICDMTFDGRDPSVTIEATLKKSTYGYPSLEEIRHGQSN